MRVDINGELGYIEINNHRIAVTKKEAQELAFQINAAIQDEDLAQEFMKGDELWAEELTRQHKQDVEEEKA
jgi:alkanesulfonate monooxygenase SsuD/methylene tetrahydromethanopterin reductase-like flavin-dependent oxidoreductase (luciferase family)